MAPVYAQLVILIAAGAVAWAVAYAVMAATSFWFIFQGREGEPPRAGGPGFTVGLFATAWLAQAFAGPLHDWAGLAEDAIPPVRFAGFLVLVLGCFTVGWMDDRRLIPRPATVLALLAVATVAVLLDLHLRQLALPRLGAVDLPWVAGGVLAICWLMIVVLAVNFFDGADGLVGRQANVLALAVLFCTVNAVWRFDVALVSVALLGASIAFVGGNLATDGKRVLLGNAGSFAVGGAMGGLLLLLVANDLKFTGSRAYYDNLLTAGIILALPLYDFGRTIISRAMRGVSVFSRDRDGLFHRHDAAVGRDRLATLSFMEPFLITFAILGAVGTRFDNPANPSSERIVLVVLLAATTCTVYRLKVMRAERKAEEDS